MTKSFEQFREEQKVIFEMVGLLPQKTGLTGKVWTRPEPEDTGEPHNIPRVKIGYRDGRNFSYSVELHPKRLKLKGKKHKISSDEDKKNIAFIRKNFKVLWLFIKSNELKKKGDRRWKLVNTSAKLIRAIQPVIRTKGKPSGRTAPIMAQRKLK